MTLQSRLRACSPLLHFTPVKGRAGTCTIETNKGTGWRQQNGWQHFPYLQRWARYRIFNGLGVVFHAGSVWKGSRAALRRAGRVDSPRIAAPVGGGNARNPDRGNSPGLAEERHRAARFPQMADG